MSRLLSIKTCVHAALIGLLLCISAWVVARPSPRFDTPASEATDTLTATTGDDPLSITVQAGGNIAASTLSLGEDCAGYIQSHAANVRIDYNVETKDASQRDVLLTLTGEAKNSLVVNGPDGRWYCANSKEGTTTALRIASPNPGQIDIWAGNFNAQRTETASLTVDTHP